MTRILTDLLGRKEGDDIDPLTQDDRELLEYALEEVDIIRRRIFSLKNHQLRVAHCAETKRQLLEGLKEGEALVIADWAQKFLPSFARERQSAYFGKKGVNWHVSHAMIRKGKEFAYHPFFHIFNYDVDQDAVAVAAIVDHVATVLGEYDISRIHLRTDNAGCYHSAPLLGSLAHPRSPSIVSYSFSEACDGKDACDRMSAQAKRRVRQRNDAGFDTATAAQLAEAITYGSPLNGTSTYLCNLNRTPKPSTEIPNINQYSFFEFDGSSLRARKHYAIGTGVVRPLSSLQPMASKLEILYAGGHQGGPFF